MTWYGQIPLASANDGENAFSDGTLAEYFGMYLTFKCNYLSIKILHSILKYFADLNKCHSGVII
jgi:hypothetical protein